MFLTCVPIVCEDIVKIVAHSAFENPRASKFKTSISRSDKGAAIGAGAVDDEGLTLRRS